MQRLEAYVACVASHPTKNRNAVLTRALVLWYDEDVSGNSSAIFGKLASSSCTQVDFTSKGLLLEVRLHPQ